MTIYPVLVVVLCDVSKDMPLRNNVNIEVEIVQFLFYYLETQGSLPIFPYSR